MRRENLSQAGGMPSVFARNTAQVNETMVRILARCAVVILVMAALSAVGLFEFGAGYTWILLGVGLTVCLLPKLLIRVLPDLAMQYLMMVSAAQVIRHLPDSAKANIPIIAMTANAFEEDRKAALENGMNGHIAKPIDVEKVRETLARVLG